MSNEPSPETLYLSACIHDGVFNPLGDGLTANDFTEHIGVLEHMAEYARLHDNEAPSLELVLRLHPTFDYVASVGMDWARANMLRHVKSERMRHHLHHVARLVGDDKLDEAMQQLADSTAVINRGVSVDGLNAADWEPTDPTVNRCPVPSGALPSITNGGIAPGQMWLYTASTNVGKSWELVKHTVAALQGGWDVVFFSLEMPIDEVMRRIITVATGTNLLSAPVRHVIKTHKKWVAEELKATLTLRGPEHGNGVITPATLASAAAPRTLIVVDYIGLMRSNSGEQAISDWRVMGAIGTDVKNVAMHHKVPILAAAQANREAMNRSHHGLDSIGQSYSLAADCDAHIAMDPYSRSTRVYTLTKNRSSGRAGIRWYAAFDIENADFGPLTPEAAFARKSRDETVDTTWTPSTDASEGDTDHERPEHALRTATG